MHHLPTICAPPLASDSPGLAGRSGLFSACRLPARGQRRQLAGPSSPAPAASGQRSHRLGSEAGMVSAETAVSLIAVANVALLVFAVLAGAMSYLHAQDLSRAAARSLSLGQERSSIVSDIRQADPKATVQFGSDGTLGAVTVRLPSAGPAGRLGISVSATTVAALEPGAGS